NGDGVALGQNQVTPLSNRTFEILSGVMADYRYREVEDLMIRATISRVATGIAENVAERIVGPAYPNPASNRIYVDIDNSLVNSPNIAVRIFDATGRNVSSSVVPVTGNRIELTTSDLSTGLYTACFSLNNAEVSRKFTIVR
ncbi:MAG: T9SS type A sorting domain-containing protein, partial [Bacteroidota bacterium]